MCAECERICRLLWCPCMPPASTRHTRAVFCLYCQTLLLCFFPALSLYPFPPLYARVLLYSSLFITARCTSPSRALHLLPPYFVFLGSSFFSPLAGSLLISPLWCSRSTLTSPPSSFVASSRTCTGISVVHIKSYIRPPLLFLGTLLAFSPRLRGC